MRPTSHLSKFFGQLGCFILFGIFVVLLWMVLGRILLFLVGLLVLFTLYINAYEAWSRFRAPQAFRAIHGPGKNLLIVYTDSPHWGPYIEEHWIPRWPNQTVLLNRSRRWSENQVEARLWRRVAGPLAHTPIAIVIPPKGKVTVVRFWRAFRDNKHGNPAALRGAEVQLEQAMAGLQSADV